MESGVNLRMIDVFSGIGGFSLAARWLGGIETVQFVECEPFCQRVLSKHWPTIPIHDDICTFQPESGSADIICGGFPCQDISTAGKQAGIKEGTRSGLFYELMRVVRLVGPRYVVLENVAAITSNGLDIVLGTLAEAGLDVEWACISAADVGACHRRDRWWCVAYSQSRRWGARPGQGASQAGYQEPGTGNGCAGSDAADTKREPSQLRRGAKEFYGATGTIEDKGNQWKWGRNTTGHSGEAATHSPRQRQQKRQPAAITSEAGQPCWSDAPRRLDSNWRSYLSQPVLCRGDNGLSGRVDRLKALGNAVVPQVAMVPLARVLELDRR